MMKYPLKRNRAPKPFQLILAYSNQNSGLSKILAGVDLSESEKAVLCPA